MNQSIEHAYYESAYKPSGIFSKDTEESMLKLIETQSNLIQTYRESDQEKKELLAKYRQLVDLQETQITDLKLKLRELRENQ